MLFSVAWRHFGAGCIALSILLLGACGAQEQTLRLHGRTMGTSYNIVLSPGHGQSNDLQADIDALLEQVNQQMSTWREDSELSRFNQYHGQDWFAVSAQVVQVVALAQQVSEATGGAFDISVGPLVNAWGFGPDSDQPNAQAIERAAELVNYQKLHYRAAPPALKKDISNMYIDLSAIAKGYGVDLVGAFLTELGVHNFMVEIGGELMTQGTNPQGLAWRIGIEQPAEDRRAIQVPLSLTDANLATSGDYRNYVERDGKRVAHILDARSAKPITHHLASVSVTANSTAQADAWATALMVLGPDGIKIAESNQINAYFLLRENAQFRAEIMSGFKPLLN